MELAVVLYLIVTSNHAPQAGPQRLTGLVGLSLALAIVWLGGTSAVGLIANGRSVRICCLPKDYCRHEHSDNDCQ
jgi:hypothetical protein